jgi:hypothetical protein
MDVDSTGNPEGSSLKVASPTNDQRDGLPQGIDPSLWFVAETCRERDYLVEAKPHTGPGRMEAYCPHDPTFPYYVVTRSEIGTCSPESKLWIRGFIVGSEPYPPVAEDGSPMSESSSEYRAWDEERANYRVTGEWPLDVPHSF